MACIRQAKAANFISGLAFMSDSEEKRSDELTSSQTPHQQKYARSLGVRKIELVFAQCKAWYIWPLLFLNILLITYVCDLNLRVRTQSLLYASISPQFSNYGLLIAVAATNLVIGVVSPPLYAKLSDQYGRLNLLIFAIILYVVGTVTVSQALNAETIYAGDIVYRFGHAGLMSILQFIIADFSNLDWRLLCFSITTIPSIINPWITDRVFWQTYRSGWSFTIWIFAIIIPCSCIPLTCFLVYMIIKARKSDDWIQLVDQGAAAKQKVWVSLKDNLFVRFFWKVDLVGIILIMGIFGLITVSLSNGIFNWESASSASRNYYSDTYGNIDYSWASVSTIVPLVIGVVLIPVFVLWEKLWARFPAVPFPLMTDRGVWSAILVGLLLTVVSNVPRFYLEVLLNGLFWRESESVIRVVSSYDVALSITSLLLGLLTVFVKRLKSLILFGVCLMIVAQGIYLHFASDIKHAQSNQFIREAIGSICFMGFSAGFIVYPTQVSLTSVTAHEFMTMAMALYMSTLEFGYWLAYSVASSVWINNAYDYIVEEFSKVGLDQEDFIEAYWDGSIISWGDDTDSPEIIAMANVSARYQQAISVVAITLCVPLLVATLFLRDHHLDKVQSFELKDIEDNFENDGTVVTHTNDDDRVVQGVRKVIGKNN